MVDMFRLLNEIQCIHPGSGDLRNRLDMDEQNDDNCIRCLASEWNGAV
jgi:hypothetical protein